MSQPASISLSPASRASRPLTAKPTTTYGANTTERSEQTMAAAHGTFAASNGTSTGANTSTGSTGDSAPSRSTFSFQFSAATEMILKRLRGEGGLLNPNATSGVRPATGPGAVQPPGYEDVRRSVLQGMKTTLNMEVPSGILPPAKKGPKVAAVTTSTPAGTDPGAATTAGSGNIGKGKASAKSGRAKAGTKRKRAKDDSDSPEESSGMSGLGGDSDSEDVGLITQLPTKTLSGRKVVKPAQFDPAALEGPSRKRAPYTYKKGGRSVEQALCKRCGRAHSPTGNLIVFCDGCNIGWHQMCHDPMVSDDLVKDASKEWFCKDCSAKRAKLENPTPEIVKDPIWSGKSVEEKRAYLATFPVPHLINLLLQAIAIHPDIPIPPAPASSSQPMQQTTQRSTDRRLHVYPQQPFPPSATSTAGLFSRAEANPNAPINFIRKIQPGGSASPSTSLAISYDHNPKPDIIDPKLQLLASAPLVLPQVQVNLLGRDEDAAGEDESRASTPASPPYPRSGNGLMAKLPPDDHDLEWLVGEGEDEAAFSHVVFGADGDAHKVDERTVGTAEKV